jgi:hypothetical protein
LAATAWEARVATRERAGAERGQAEAVRQRAEAVAQKALAESRSREALAERARAEEQAGVATRQEKLAEQQRAVAESRLSDVGTLANSMFSELDDDVKELAGSAKARETLTRLGLQYLNKMSAQSGGSGQLRSQLGAAYLKVRTWRTCRIPFRRNSRRGWQV